MDAALLVARLLLAAVFVVAGVAKLADREGSERAMRGFGVPDPLAKPFGRLLPLAEIAVAALLLLDLTAWWGALGALALLVLFVAGIGINLAQGKQPDCHCFGQLHSEPAGVSTLIRNTALAIVAGFILLATWQRPMPSLTGWMGEMTTVETLVLVLAAIVAVMVCAQWWMLVQMLRQNGRLLLRLEALEAGRVVADAEPQPGAAQPAAGLAVGTPAPGFTLAGLHGETMTLDALRAPGKPVLLLFTDPKCGPCNALLPDISRWQREYAAQLTVASISRGTAEANRPKSAEHGLTHVLLQKDREVAAQFKGGGTPAAVVVRSDGSIGSPLVQGSDSIRALVARTVGAPVPAPQARPATPAAPAAASRPAAPSMVGKAAPPLELPDLDGRTVRLEDFRGNKTVVLFWRPGCGFCKRMLPDLKAWEQSRSPNAPKLLIVSSESAESNRDQGLTSPIVLDSGFAIGRAFGASGTPSAVLVDEQGNIASDRVVGGPAVLALANRPDPAGRAS